MRKFIGVATDTVSYALFEGFVIHEVYDGLDCFKHRLIYAPVSGATIEGEWVTYKAFARLSFECNECCTQHILMACQDNWQPMFPPLFAVKIPDADKVPGHLMNKFLEFLEMRNDVVQLKTAPKQGSH